LRYKELSHLEWTDIDFTTHVLHVRKKVVIDGDKAVEFTPKKCSIRDVAIPDDVVAGLVRLKTISNSHLVFPTRSGRINTKLWDSCKRIAGRSGVTYIAKFKPKNFRSTFATNRLRNNYTLADIRDQMGHRDIHSVEHYLEALRSEDLVTSGRVDKGWD